MPYFTQRNEEGNICGKFAEKNIITQKRVMMILGKHS